MLPQNGIFWQSGIRSFKNFLSAPTFVLPHGDIQLGKSTNMRTPHLNTALTFRHKTLETLNFFKKSTLETLKNWRKMSVATLTKILYKMFFSKGACRRRAGQSCLGGQIKTFLDRFFNASKPYVLAINKRSYMLYINLNFWKIECNNICISHISILIIIGLLHVMQIESFH